MTWIFASGKHFKQVQWMRKTENSCRNQDRRMETAGIFSKCKLIHSVFVLFYFSKAFCNCQREILQIGLMSTWLRVSFLFYSCKTFSLFLQTQLENTGCSSKDKIIHKLPIIEVIFLTCFAWSLLRLFEKHQIFLKSGSFY